MISFLNKVFSSVFFIGFIKGGGTIAALIAVIIFFYIDNTYILLWTLIIAMIMGVLSAEYMEKEWGEDSSKIVIDEFAGTLMALFLIPVNIVYFIIAFILFRFFDIIKVFPINKLQDNIKGGAGVMIDDIVSGIFANILLRCFICIKETLF